ncbi:hypothetical protein QEN19_002841 [Hanseniaspora menglaensis]
MSDNDSIISKEFDRQSAEDSSNSDSSIGIKNFGQDDSEISEDELNNSSGDEDAEDKLLETIQLKLATRKQNNKNNQANGVIFVDEFQSDSNDKNNTDIDDVNMNDNKLKILKDERSIKKNGKYYNKPPRFLYSVAQMNEKIQEGPQNIKNVAVIGPFRSGKTSLVSNMIVKNHRKHFQRQKYDYLNLKRYMDNSLITKYRKTTTRLNMGRFLHDNSVIMNVIDTPGHSDFWNETKIALEMSDFAYIVIDSVEGVTDSVVKLYEIAHFQMGLNVAFILNKVDRLVLELKLDETHFFLKLQDIVNDINTLEGNAIYSPERGNVLFASSKYHFMFSIKQFLSILYKNYRENDQILEYMTQRTWGNVVFEDGKFSAVINWKQLNKNPSFVSFIATPLYEIFKNGLILQTKELKNWVQFNFGFELMSSSDDEEYTPQLVKLFESIFENSKLSNKIPEKNHCFVENAVKYSKKLTDSLALTLENKGMEAPSPLVRVFKAIDYKQKIWSLCKVCKGTVSIGDTLYSQNAKKMKVAEIAVMGGRYVLNIKTAYENQIVLIRSELKNADDIIGMGTLTSEKSHKNIVFPNIDFVNEPVVKVFLQPKQFKHLHLLNKALQLIQNLYPDIKITVETSREYTLYGSGELQLDTILFELRYFYMCYFNRNVTDFIEIKTTGNIVATFKEGCSEQSFAAIPVSSKNYSVSIVSTPIGEDLSEAICKKQFSAEYLFKRNKLVDLSAVLRNDFKWESNLSRNIIAVSGTNFLLNDILPEDLNLDLFEKVKPHLIEGFERVVAEGPLLEEGLHNVIFKLMSLDNLNENGTSTLEMLPLTIKACKVAMLSAKPILLEPYYSFSIMSNVFYNRNIKSVLKRRRGTQIFSIKDIPGSSLVQFTGIIPGIDSNGLSIDLKLVTQGSSICQLTSIYKRWYKVPGDVLDEKVQLSKLEPAEGDALSREFLMKTRKRKGLESGGTDPLNDNGPTLKDYIEEDLFLQLKELKLI